MVTNYFAPVILMVASTAQGGILFVDDSAVGSRNGSSWANAFTDLNDALAVAVAGDDVWVAVGTYAPDPTAPFSRTLTFTIPDEVELYGGFAGTEQSFAERAGLFEQTILTGDLAGDDFSSTTTNAENSYHVVTVLAGTTALLDGFRVVAGNANGAAPDDGGAGMRCLEGSHATIMNCTFAGSTSDREGGALRAGVSSVVTIQDCRFELNRVVEKPAQGGALFGTKCEFKISGCTFDENSAGHAGHKNNGANGGAIALLTAKAVVEHCMFRSNFVVAGHSGSGMGGAIYSTASLTLRDSQFVGNHVTWYEGRGGAVRVAAPTATLLVERCGFSSNRVNCTFACGGAILADSHVILIGSYFGENSVESFFDDSFAGAVGAYSSLKATNCVFVGNRSATSCAVNSSATTLIQCTFVGNGAYALGGPSATAFDAVAGPTKIRNCIFHGNAANGVVDQAAQLHATGASIEFTLVDGWTGSLGGTGNFDADPSFVDGNGPDGVLGSLDDDLRLGADSPCLEAGDNAQLPLDTTDADSDGITNEPIPFDLDGAPRVWFTHVLAPTGVGGPPIVDLGAYERHGDICAPSLGYQGPGNLTLALCGDDLTQAASVATMRVSNGPPLSSVVLAIGSTALPTPFLGGILVPSPIVAVVILPTNASGTSVMPVLNHAGGTTTTFYAQAMTPPPTPQFSNALAVQIGW